MARDVYTRRQEGTSVWVVRSRPDRRQRPGRQGHVLRPDGRQGLPPPDLLRAARRRSTTCEARRCKLPSKSTTSPARAVPAAHRRHLPDPRPAPRRVVRPRAGARRRHRLANMALDLVGQARALLTHAGQLEGRGHDEDQLAFLRDERDYRNLTLVELPRGDFAFTVLRNAMVATLAEAAVGAPARLERRRAGRHRRQGGQGGALPPAACGRLGGAAGRRHRRIARGACERALRAAVALRRPSCSTPMRSTTRPQASGLGPRWAELREPWLAEMRAILDEAGLRRAGRVGLPQHRQARRAQRAHGLHPGRDAAPAARLSRRRVVSARAAVDATTRVRARVGRARHRARPRGAGAVGARPRHRARRDRRTARRSRSC